MPVSKEDKRSSFDTISARTLTEREFPPLLWIVDEILPPGLTILSGAPKVGKSWFILQLAKAVAEGGLAWRRFKANKSGVLYLALEDSERRLQERQEILADGTWPENLYYCLEKPDNLEEALEKWLDEHPDCRLVAIDTLVKFFPDVPKGANEYQFYSKKLAPLQRLALDRDVALILIHHNRKEVRAAKDRNGDPLDMVLGTTGINGAADITMIITRSRNSSEGEFFLTGRDVEEKAYKATLESCMWTISEIDEKSTQSIERKKIIEFLTKNHAPKGPKDISNATGLSYDSVKQLVRKMVKANEIAQEEKGLYTVHRSPKSESPSQDSIPAVTGAGSPSVTHALKDNGESEVNDQERCLITPENHTAEKDSANVVNEVNGGPSSHQHPEIYTEPDPDDLDFYYGREWEDQ